MRIQTILNRVEKFKSFACGRVSLEQRSDGPALVVEVRPRRNRRPNCSGCGGRGPAYDRLEERLGFVPDWGIVVFLAYRMRRGDCERRGVTVEMVPWFVISGRAPGYRRLPSSLSSTSPTPPRRAGEIN